LHIADVALSRAAFANTFVSGRLFHYKFSTAKYERIASPVKPVKITTIRFNA
jgi:hypothetical protein